jgi:hypothetical protein
MTPRPIFIGAEADAAGYRMAGLEIRVPERGAEGAALEEARAHAPLVLVSAEVAARIPRPTCKRRSALAPATVIVPEVLAAGGFDVAARLRRELGLEG